MIQPVPKFCFFGTPAVARDTLATLIESGFTPALVITAPDAPRGRGLELASSPTKTLALEHGIPLMTPETLDTGTIAAITAHVCDFSLVVAYGKIFPEALITSFPRGVLNVHYSLLPKYRGATPLEGALLAGETVTGVTIQRMIPELDAGDILAQEELPVGANETARDLRPKLIALGARLLVDTLRGFIEDTIVPRAQDAALATYTHKLKKEDGLLDLRAPGAENWNTYRAYADSIGTYFIRDGKRYKITAAEFKNGAFYPLRVIPEGKKETDCRG